MFGLIRRISTSVIARPDRPWPEDATSNAPKKGRKRRLSNDEDEEENVASLSKKVKGETPLSTPAEPSAEVKAVTQGVDDIGLETKEPVAAESVPLPEEKSGELDAASPSSISSTPTPEPEANPEEPEISANATPEVAEEETETAEQSSAVGLKKDLVEEATAEAEPVLDSEGAKSESESS
ncbi:hypothetical protein C8J56DRAFT_429308 [Mycena floridula]|nr:hypothetical protein C8J56DRAFT_429308 [Mycena floridula]